MTPKQTVSAPTAPTPLKYSEAIRALLHPDVTWIAPAGNATQVGLGEGRPDEAGAPSGTNTLDREEIVDFMSRRFAVLSGDASMEFLSMTAEHEVVVAEFRLSATLPNGRTHERVLLRARSGRWTGQRDPRVHGHWGGCPGVRGRRHSARCRDGDRRRDVRTTGIYRRVVLGAPASEQHGDGAVPVAAEVAGYRACLRCRSDQPSRRTGLRSDRPLVATALDRIAAGFLDDGTPSDLVTEAGLSVRHLRRLFREHRRDASQVRRAAAGPFRSDVARRHRSVGHRHRARPGSAASDGMNEVVRSTFALADRAPGQASGPPDRRRRRRAAAAAPRSGHRALAIN
ncbi:MAG: hypothetical protein R2705_19705 [Ilumatobacteraceae bacterium]